MTFSITRLAGSEALVSGTDVNGNSGQQVVSTLEWDDVKQHALFHQAVGVFDAKQEEFFAPLVEAAAEVDRILKGAVKPADPIDFVVMVEGVEGTEGTDREVRALSEVDSKILRLIEEGKSDRLLWVHDQLVITEYVEAPAKKSGKAKA